MMEIVFADKRLKDAYEKPGELERLFGPRKAELIRIRIQTLKAVDNMNQLWSFPGHFHPLREDRAGEWACNLDHVYRLIFKYIPDNKALIVDIVNYHGK
ncbi:MAG: type II toxin-antitoxin system RelE/ParE family toxin [Bacteroidales bacterium]|nr:type II toxin-antitoxin system RelE/ParE family toxin [Bacteroidales bacterium]